MAIRQIVQYEDSVGSKTLSKPSVAYDFKDQTSNPIGWILEDLWDTFDANETAVGLAAVQIDIGIRIFVMQYAGKRREVINPVILKKSNDYINNNKEACLSRPGVEKKRRRSQAVMLKWQNYKGKTCTKRFSGFEAIVIQHEMDHLAGKDCLYG